MKVVKTLFIILAAAIFLIKFCKICWYRRRGSS